MKHEIILTGVRPEVVAEPQQIRSALRILGIVVSRRDFPSLDREYLLYDAKVAFKKAIRTAHADHGGSDDAARPIISAYRIVKRYCTPAVWRAPRSREQRQREDRATLYEQL